MSALLGLVENKESENLSPLTRSVEKPKVSSEGPSSPEETIVPETPLPVTIEQSLEPQRENYHLEMLKEAALEGRRVVSYKDAILGVNGGASESSDDGESFSYDDSNSEEEWRWRIRK
ncbi:hypothetical protein SESBI_51025 [Sesbania bispinosa]|nr:hypothetical protein SESBI_51025 [Sesbania bispinosa]